MFLKLQVQPISFMLADMSTKLADIAVTAWARLIRAQQAMLERVETDLKTAGLPPLAWYDVLLELNRAEGGKLRQFEIGGKVLMSKYNVSRLLDRLEQGGMINRQTCKEDRRGAHIIITRGGKALVKKMWPVYAHGIERYFTRHLSAPEIEQLSEIMTRLIIGSKQP